jgi:predicted subunit of tRNA(5-methylaminomethyl-2-thiouridylate) methyltransferase
MRIINVILVSQGIVHSIKSYGIFEDQLSSEIIEQAEAHFKMECLQLDETITESEMDVYLENGYFDSESNYISVNIAWSNIN